MDTWDRLTDLKWERLGGLDKNGEVEPKNIYA